MQPDESQNKDAGVIELEPASIGKTMTNSKQAINTAILTDDFDIRSEIIRNRNMIDELKSKISLLKEASKHKNNIISGLETAEYLKKAKIHNRRGDILKALRVVALFLFVVAYSSYQYSLYSNPNINKLSQSGIESMDHMEVPYFYLRSYAEDYDFTVDSIGIDIYNPATGSAFTWYNVSTIHYDVNNPYIYNESTVEWTAVEYCHSAYICTNLGPGYTLGSAQYFKTVFLVPPYGMILQVEQTLSVLIYTDHMDMNYTFYSNYTNNTNGISAILWEIDAISTIQNADIDELQDQYFEQERNLKYTFADTQSFHMVDLFEQIDKTQEPTAKTLSYSATYTASLDMIKYPAMTSYDITIYQNPAGGGTKTTLTMTKRQKWTDVLANIGGITSPVITISTILLMLIMFGIHIGPIRIDGFSQLSPLRYAQRQQLKLYLIQLGVFK